MLHILVQNGNNQRDSEPSQKSMMYLFAKMVKSFQQKLPS